MCPRVTAEGIQQAGRQVPVWILPHILVIYLLWWWHSFNKKEGFVFETLNIHQVWLELSKGSYLRPIFQKGLSKRPPKFCTRATVFLCLQVWQECPKAEWQGRDCKCSFRSLFANTTLHTWNFPTCTSPSGRSLNAQVTKRDGPTEPRLRLVLMLCFPLSPSSSSLTGLNIKGGGSTGFSMGGSSPYFLKWMRQSVHSKMFSRPPWCQSLEAFVGNIQSIRYWTPTL